MLRLYAAAQAALISRAHRRPSAARPAARPDHGQTTAEYALVLLGAAAVALLLVAWTMKTHKLTNLLDAVLDRVMQQLP